MTSPLKTRAGNQDSRSAQKRSQCHLTSTQNHGQGKSERWNLM
jgi:hypothetical protein